MQLVRLLCGDRTASIHVIVTTGPTAAPTMANASAPQDGPASTALNVSQSPAHTHNIHNIHNIHKYGLQARGFVCLILRFHAVQVAHWASLGKTAPRCASAGTEATVTTSPDCAPAAQVSWAASANRVRWAFPSADVDFFWF